MAYAAIVHLKHILEEEVICFLRKLLEVEKAKAVEFQAKSNEGLKRLKISRNSNDELCSHPIFNRFSRLKGCRKLSCRCCEGSEGVRGDLLLESIASIMNDLDDVSTSLEGFLHSLDGSCSSQQRAIANDLLSGNRKIRAALSLCKQASEAAISLRKTVCSLAGFKRWVSADGVSSRIRMTANKAADSMEDLLTGFKEDKDNYEIMKSLFDELKQIDGLLQMKDDEVQLVSEIMVGKMRVMRQIEEIRVEIEAEYLLWLWVANGFLKSKFSNYLEMEAEDYLNDIIGRNLVSIGKRGLDGKIKTCFIHPLVRQLCLEEALKENFMQVLEPSANAQVQENKRRHLIFNSEDLDDFKTLSPHPHLSSIICINRGSDFTSGMVLLQISVSKWLRVLDIYFVSFNTFPLELLNLVNLRFLAINVSYELDARISKLWKLETFIVYGPWGSKATLFLEFWKMLYLKNVLIRVPSCLKYPYLLSPLLDVLKAPSNLQILSVITFSSCTRELFLLMPKLKKLGVSETKEDFENGELTKCFHNLFFLNQLQVLNCSFYKGNTEMRYLDLHVLPVSLTKLTLDGGDMSWDKIKFLSLLPKLETLKLKNHAFKGPEWMVTEEVFGSMKHLLIENTDLVNWEVESTHHFPCLKSLILRSCELLEKIPEGVAELSVLEVIELHHCSESAKSSAQDYEEQYGFPKVVCRG